MTDQRLFPGRTPDTRTALGPTDSSGQFQTLRDQVEQGLVDPVYFLPDVGNIRCL